MKLKPYLISLSFIPIIGIVYFLSKHPLWIEHYYSNGLYQVIATVSRFLSGLFYFSIGDILYLLIIGGLLYVLYTKAKIWWRKPQLFIKSLFSWFSILLFVFYLSWGLNYYRIPLEKSLDISTQYTQEELENWVNQLIDRTNHLQLEITGDSLVAVSLTLSPREIYSQAIQGYQSIALPIKNSSYPAPSLKSSLLSKALSYMGYGGYFNPFTHEAQVNKNIPRFRLPSISCHEIGHQLGYGSESDTNFISFLIASQHQSPYFRYAAYHSMLAYGLNEIHKTHPKQYPQWRQKVHPGVLENYREVVQFWEDYENPLEPFFKLWFDQYLKLNQQIEGISSYNRVVGLLIGYQRKYP